MISVEKNYWKIRVIRAARYRTKKVSRTLLIIESHHCESDLVNVDELLK